ncbi:MAG: hypothetical protein LBN95_05230 [Prevotellaceae bacterium]|nr:hypothetical protein [Prevotellaceae bacterium]
MFNLNVLSSTRNTLNSSISEPINYGSNTDYFRMGCGGCDGTCNDYCKGNCTGIFG